MASFTKVNDFTVNMANAMDLDSDTLKVALSNTDPTAGTDVTADGNGVLANALSGIAAPLFGSGKSMMAARMASILPP